MVKKEKTLMKKILLIILTITVLISAFIFPVSAEGNADIFEIITPYICYFWNENPATCTDIEYSSGGDVYLTGLKAPKDYYMQGDQYFNFGFDMQLKCYNKVGTLILQFKGFTDYDENYIQSVIQNISGQGGCWFKDYTGNITNASQYLTISNGIATFKYSGVMPYAISFNFCFLEQNSQATSNEDFLAPRMYIFGGVFAESSNATQSIYQEKNEANNGGNSSVGELTGIVPDHSDGLLSAFGNLTSSMMTTSTESSIMFPGIKIPSVSPYWNTEIVLLGEYNIDFRSYVDMAPQNIIKLVRAVLTVALIIYCFKELYVWFGFIFTSKGGGDIE